MKYKKMSDRARITNLTELITDSKRLGFDKREEEKNKMAYVLSVVRSR